jgi:hypothetical protein
MTDVANVTVHWSVLSGRFRVAGPVVTLPGLGWLGCFRPGLKPIE